MKTAICIVFALCCCLATPGKTMHRRDIMFVLNASLFGCVDGQANSNLSYLIGLNLTNYVNARAGNLDGATNGLDARAMGLESQTNSLGSRASALDSGKQPTNNTLTLLAGTGALTNSINLVVSNVFASNFIARAGASASNAFVGGTIYSDRRAFTNLNGSGTISNLAGVIIPAHTITNNGDLIRAEWGGRTANALANTNQFQLSLGGTVFLDTGLLPASNTVFKAWCSITRTATGAQHVEAGLDWGPATGIAFIRTNVNLEMSINAGIDQILTMRGGSRRVGAHTNNSFRVWFDPAPR